MVKAEGRLAHKFHGQYYSVIGLAFQDEASASEALVTLGDDWKHGASNRAILVIVADMDKSETIKEKLKGYDLKIQPCTWKHCRDQCAGAEIDSLRHSIDYGPDFTVNIPTTPKEQASLF